MVDHSTRIGLRLALACRNRVERVQQGEKFIRIVRRMPGDVLRRLQGVGGWRTAGRRGRLEQAVAGVREGGDAGRQQQAQRVELRQGGGSRGVQRIDDDRSQAAGLQISQRSKLVHLIYELPFGYRYNLTPLA